MEVTNEGIYRGIVLNRSAKGKNGFYIDHLRTIYSLMVQARIDMAEPLVSHFVIESPKQCVLSRLSEELKRWNHSRPYFEEPIPVKYFACIETRPRKNQKHLHLMVIFQSLSDNQDDLKQLRKRLAKLSVNKQSKLLRRKGDSRKLIVDHQTGEIATTRDGALLRLGSVLYHKLNSELYDAFNRFSYLAKVQTKAVQQNQGIDYSSSRIFRPAGSIASSDIAEGMTLKNACANGSCRAKGSNRRRRLTSASCIKSRIGSKI